jgi:hypothetical protein
MLILPELPAKFKENQLRCIFEIASNEAACLKAGADFGRQSEKSDRNQKRRNSPPSPFSRVVGLGRAICGRILRLGQPFETNEFGDLCTLLNIRQRNTVCQIS